MVYIFPTNRAVREFYSKNPDINRLLLKSYSIQSFLEQSLYVDGKIRADSLIRNLCMQEAVDFDAFELLHIPKQFMAFVQHSSYLFRFFEELAGEELSFDALYGADAYAQYDEHLGILETVYFRYCKRLEELGYYDAITLVKDGVIDEEFIGTLREITLYHEGYFSKFEHRILSKISKIIPVHVNMTTTPYNKPEVEKIFNTEVGVNFEIVGKWREAPNTLYEYSSDIKVVSSSFTQRSLQVGFIFDQIARFIENGVEPEKIAIVLPDETFAHFLRIYDKNKLLNFAMGLSFEDNFFYQKIKANQAYLNHPNEENLHRRSRLGIMPLWDDVWGQKVNYVAFKDFLNIDDSLSLEAKEILELQMLKFERLFAWMGSIVFSEAISLFLQELSQERFDDVGGGVITVMGVLETRGSSFDGVIIPDFNESMIPKRSEKDLFLSSSVRSFAGIPDSYDREQLQRYYYHKLLMQAKHKAISYVKNEESMPSRFLHSFNVDFWTYDEVSLASLFMQKRETLMPIDEEPKIFHEVTKTPLSSSRLKVLLTCARQYYYKYIEKLPEAIVPTDTIKPIDVGNFIHEAFEELYKNPPNQKIFTDPKVWMRRVHEILSKSKKLGLMWELESGVWAKRLEAVCEIEMKRFAQGWRPWKLEESFVFKHEGVTLKGRIDRIDRNEEGSLEVLDYKTGATLQSGPKRPENRVDFQLIFYYLLASNLGSVDRVGYYDLAGGRVVYEKALQPSIKALFERIDTHKTMKTYEKTTKESDCTYCPYALLCQRKSGWN